MTFEQFTKFLADFNLKCNISEFGFETLKRWLPPQIIKDIARNAEYLTEVDVKFPSIDDTFIEYLLVLLEHNTHVVNVDVGFNRNITIDAINSLAANNRLLTLSAINRSQQADILNHFEKYHSLQQLEITFGGQSEEQMTKVANSTSLKVLDIAASSINRVVEVSRITSVVDLRLDFVTLPARLQAINLATSIQKLYLKHVQLSPGYWKPLIFNSTLTSLHFEGRVGIIDVDEMVLGLASSTHLLELTIENRLPIWNTFTSEHVEQLLKNTVLTSLAILDIRDLSKEVSSQLSRNSTLRDITLITASNFGYNVDLNTFAFALASNHHLRKLNFSANGHPMNAEGYSLDENATIALASHPSVTSLKFHALISNRVAHAIANNARLRHFASDSPITDNELCITMTSKSLRKLEVFCPILTETAELKRALSSNHLNELTLSNSIFSELRVEINEILALKRFHERMFFDIVMIFARIGVANIIIKTIYEFVIGRTLIPFERTKGMLIQSSVVTLFGSRDKQVSAPMPKIATLTCKGNP